MEDVKGLQPLDDESMDAVAGGLLVLHNGMYYVMSNDGEYAKPYFKSADIEAAKEEAAKFGWNGEVMTSDEYAKIHGQFDLWW